MKVILPGSYDPVTVGHLDVIRQAAATDDEAYVVVFRTPDKTYTFPLEDRVRMLTLATEDFSNVIVSYGLGFVIDYMREHGIGKIVKGYRNETDLAYEKNMAKWNYEHGGYETEFIECKPEFAGISSTLARKRIAEGGDLSGILPPAVIAFLKNR
ncbi:MAG: pantetheine-phosphate adenylyltransferase [Clostridia bacterium]|nr:pantetheine-phosphate adenylyltransferase [Clostridia bacterium]